MNKENNKIVPNLRFPEFQDKDEWIEDTLDQISPSIFDGTHQTPKYTENGIPFFSVENIVSGNKNKFISKEDYITATVKNKPEKGDILITRIGNIGFSAIVNWDYEFSIYVTLAVIKKSDKFDSYYLHSYFQSEQYQSEIRTKSLLNAMPCKINMNELRRTKVLLPPTKPEQLKIADCLSSLDELISAHSQKLDALKTHKKGLIQQLFPAEGETMPKLRFKEFEKNGEWVESAIGIKCNSFSGGTPTSNKAEYYGREIPFIRSGEIDKSITELFLTSEGLNNSSAKLVEIGDVLVALYGANSGEVALAKIKGAINQAILCLKSEECNPFIYHYLSFKKSWIISKYIQGGQGNLSGDIIKSIKLKFPKPVEQEKIASCLSSLDEQITAQARKIEALKEHKKGLMQQLFPSMENKTTTMQEYKQ